MGACGLKLDYAGRDLQKVLAVKQSDGITASFAPDATGAYADEDVFSPLLLLPVGSENCTGTNGAGSGIILDLLLGITVPSGAIPTPAFDIWLIDQVTLPSLNFPNAPFALTEGQLPPQNIIGKIAITAGDWVTIDTLNSYALKKLGQNALTYKSSAYNIGAFLVAQAASTWVAASTVTIAAYIHRD